MESEPTPARPRIPPGHALAGLLILIALVEMAWLSVARYRAYQASTFDLGVMAQAIWRAGQGDALVFTAEGIAISRLARHFELIYFALVPLYRLLPTPETLVILQACFYATGAWPVFRLAQRRLNHQGAAAVVTAVYLFYPVMQTAVLFDFHGDVLAVPFLLWALEAADRRAWRPYALAVALALSCKVYVAPVVAALGLVLWLGGERRAGRWTVAVSVVWGFVAFLAIRPLFAPPEAAAANLPAPEYLDFYFGGLATVAESWAQRLLNLIIVLLPAIWLAWRAPLWLLPALVVIGPAVVSTGPGPAYDYRTHHYALAVPFLAAAVLYGAEARRRVGGRGAWHLPLALTLLLTLLLNAFLVDLPFSPIYYGRSVGIDTYERTARDRLKDVWLEQNVPPEAAVSAEGYLAAHLTNRDLLYLTDHSGAVRSLPELLPELDLVIADALHRDMVAYEAGTIRLMLQSSDFGLVEARDGLLKFERGRAGMVQSVQVLPAGPSETLRAIFGEAIGLVEAELVPMGGRRYLARFQWQAQRPLAGDERFVAVSRPEGIDQARIPHLPTMALLPTAEWKPGQIVEERFEFSLPSEAPPGTYRLWVGWYDSRSPHAADTDERSRLGDEVLVGLLEVAPG
jgi:uncharacterized membrane protein